jgi:hypothetical protein
VTHQIAVEPGNIDKLMKARRIVRKEKVIELKAARQMPTH